MPMQRFRSNSSSSVVDSPPSPIHSLSYSTSTNTTSFSTTRCEAINVPPPSSTTASSQDSVQVSTSPRSTLSPIGGAAGVMKKFLRRRRGNTHNSGDGGGTGVGGPSSPTAVASFVIVGGQGDMAPGAMVYDLDPFHPLSPTPTRSPATITPNSSSSPTGPSPRSPTFPQSMFTRLTGRQPTMEILAPFAVSSISRGRAYPSSVLDGSTRGSFTVSPASTRKRTNRRSLSADNLWTPNRLRPLDEAINVTMCQQSPEPPSDNSSEGTLPITQSDKRQQLHEIQEADYEFYNSSLEFLNTHHSRINTGDRWVNRNKRKPYVPLRRQSESSLMSKVLEVTRETTGSMIDPLTADPKEDSFTPFDQPSCWRDFDQSCSSDADMDTDCRTLLSPVDIMLVSSISSPTRYYDCPKYRKLVKTYLSSTEQEFDEMIEFGFPYSGIVDDKDGMDYKAKDYRFLTLRMTLTPWHARANEVNLYGHEDSEKQIPVQEKVNKFLSRTSAMLSCSSQRVSSYVQDIRSSNSKGPKFVTPDHSSTFLHAQFSTSDTRRAPSASQGSCISVKDSGASTEIQGSIELGPGGLSTQRDSPSASKQGNRKDKGLFAMDPTTPPLTAVSTIRNVRSTEDIIMEHERFVSPPSSPSLTGLRTHAHPSQQHPPRKGSLPFLPQSNGRSPVEDTIVPPVVPPRRKTSSPAVLSCQAIEYLSSGGTSTRHGPITSTSSSLPSSSIPRKVRPTRSRSPSACAQLQQAITTTTKNGTFRVVQQEVRQPLQDTVTIDAEVPRNGIQEEDPSPPSPPTARIPRGASRKRPDPQQQQSMSGPTTGSRITPTHIENTYDTPLPPQQERLHRGTGYHCQLPKLIQQQNQAHVVYIPRTQFVAAVNSH